MRSHMNGKSGIQRLLELEADRQQSVINLVASENYVSQDVLAALGSELTHKYSEGYPGARYYGGNRYADEVEEACCKAALKLMGLSADEWNVNVQALSGTPANLAVYASALGFNKEARIMGLALDHGGHLSHGFTASFTGKLWGQVPYFVDSKTEQLNYDEIHTLAQKHSPEVIVAGFTAYSRQVDFAKFREIADSCGAHLHADISHIGGLVAARQHPSPFPWADTVMSTTHKTLRGPRSAVIWSRRDERELGKLINRAIFPGLQGGPHMNQIAAAAIALEEARGSEFAEYISLVLANAKTMADQLSRLGWRIVTGGTDTHLFLVDTWQAGSGVSGKEASDRLEQAGIIVNKNTIPNDERPASDPSGIRIGTAAETTRGKSEKDMEEIAIRIDSILRKQ